MALPRTIYVWLVLLILAFGISETQGRLVSQTTEGKGSLLTDTDFRAVLMADVAARQAFAFKSLSEEQQRALPSTDIVRRLEKQRRDSLQKAITDFRRLGAKGQNPRTPRKVLILEHADGRPLDTAFLETELVPDLKAQGIAEAEIQAETRFWTRLYGALDIDADTLTPYIKRVEAMNLGYIENQLLADVHRAAGDTASAERYERLLSQESEAVLSRQILVTLVSIVFLLIGVVVLLLFNANAVRNRWDKIGADAKNFPEDSRPQHIGFGALADVFIAYLTILQLMRLTVELVVVNFLQEPSRAVILAVTSGAYILPSVLATFYLAATLRRYNVPWSAIGIGLGGRPVGSQIWYGFLGYCAALPLIALLGQVAQRIFQNNPNAAPNPILPLVTSEPDPLGRLVIFLLAALAAPLFEELFFRGVLLTALRSRYSFIASLLISAILFAVVHPMQDWLPILALGITLGTLRLIRNSLVPGIVAHAFQNAMTFFTLSVLVGN